MATTRIRIQTLDDAEVGAEGKWFETATHMCAADRLAFEEKFGVSAAIMAAFRDRFDATGHPLPGMDMSDVYERYVLFFVWAPAFRAGVPSARGGYDEFAASVAEYDVVDEEEDAADSPTDPTGSTEEGVPTD